MPAMPLVDHVKEHVGGIRAVGEIPDLVDDQDGWMRIGLQGLGELPRFLEWSRCAGVNCYL